jgi:hypothetical protein
VTAVSAGWWPERADEELRGHVATCAVCRDVVLVASALTDADAETGPRPLPDASAVWLKAQIRARAEAMRMAERPISVAQAVGFAAAVGVLGALLGASSPWLRSALDWMGRGFARLDPRALELSPALWGLALEHAGFAAAILVTLVTMPIVVYWVTRET